MGEKGQLRQTFLIPPHNPKKTSVHLKFFFGFLPKFVTYFPFLMSWFVKNNMIIINQDLEMLLGIQESVNNRFEFFFEYYFLKWFWNNDCLRQRNEGFGSFGSGWFICERLQRLEREMWKTCRPLVQVMVWRKTQENQFWTKRYWRPFEIKKKMIIHHFAVLVLDNFHIIRKIFIWLNWWNRFCKEIILLLWGLAKGSSILHCKMIIGVILLLPSGSRKVVS